MYMGLTSDGEPFKLCGQNKKKKKQQKEKKHKQQNKQGERDPEKLRTLKLF